MGGPLGRRCMRARAHPHRHGEAVDARSDDSQAARELPGHCAEDQDGAEPENRSIRQAPQVDLDSHQDEEEGDEEGRRRVEQFRERGLILSRTDASLTGCQLMREAPGAG